MGDLLLPPRLAGSRLDREDTPSLLTPKSSSPTSIGEYSSRWLPLNRQRIEKGGLTAGASR